MATNNQKLEIGSIFLHRVSRMDEPKEEVAYVVSRFTDKSIWLVGREGEFRTKRNDYTRNGKTSVQAQVGNHWFAYLKEKPEPYVRREYAECDADAEQLVAKNIKRIGEENRLRKEMNK